MDDEDRRKIVPPAPPPNRPRPKPTVLTDNDNWLNWHSPYGRRRTQTPTHNHPHPKTEVDLHYRRGRLNDVGLVIDQTIPVDLVAYQLHHWADH